MCTEDDITSDRQQRREFFMKEFLENIKKGRGVRENLAPLCDFLRKNGAYSLTAAEKKEIPALGRTLLSHEDPKVRKNAAKLLRLSAEFDDSPEETIAALYRAYESEQTLYVRSAYPEAMAGRDISAWKELLSERLESLRNTAVEEADRKHVNEETQVLAKLLSEKAKHHFAGYALDNTILFVTQSCYREAFSETLGGMRKKIVAGGVIVRTTKSAEILPNRIWREAVFRIPEAMSIPSEPYEAAKVLAGNAVYAYLAARLKGEGAFAYRIDFRCRDESVKGKFIKRLSLETDRISGGRLINSPGDYEITFRISETEGSECRLGVVFSGLDDRRFSYRREAVAGSLHPTDAAYLMLRAKPYLAEDAQVLDPFCGVGTMIAERRKAGKIRSAFGVDTFAEAIEKARRNVRADDVWFVHRDFFDYTQDHMFDEIITNMPFDAEGETDAVRVLYRRFFAKVPEFLRKSGVIAMVSHNPALVRATLPEYLTVSEHFPMREKGEIAGFLIRYTEACGKD